MLNLKRENRLLKQEKRLMEEEMIVASPAMKKVNKVKLFVNQGALRELGYTLDKNKLALIDLSLIHI